MQDKVIPFQYDMFETPQERLLRMRLQESEALLKATKASLDKVRKGTYARINEMSACITDLKSRLDILERHICTK